MIRAGARRAARAARALRKGIIVACAGAVMAAGPAVAAPRSVQIVVRTAENLHSVADVEALVRWAADSGIDTLSVLVKQDEDRSIPSGQVFFASRIAPVAAGYARFDVLATLIPLAHARGLRVRAWLPQFHDQVLARAHPEWQMRTVRKGRVVPFTGSGPGHTEYFVNPLEPGVQDYELSLIREVVSRYAVDGIMLDWLRFDNFDMDLGDTTRAAFKGESGIDPLTIDFTRDGPARDAWNRFRTDGIARYAARVRAAIRPEVSVGAYILPPEFVEVAQDAARFRGSVGSLAPMCYFGDWGFPVDWVWTSCLPSVADKAGETAVEPVLGIAYSDAQNRLILAHLDRAGPRVCGLTWFFHDRWTEARVRQAGALSREDRPADPQPHAP